MQINNLRNDIEKKLSSLIDLKEHREMFIEFTQIIKSWSGLKDGFIYQYEVDRGIELIQSLLDFKILNDVKSNDSITWDYPIELRTWIFTIMMGESVQVRTN